MNEVKYNEYIKSNKSRSNTHVTGHKQKGFKIIAYEQYCKNKPTYSYQNDYWSIMQANSALNL